MGAKEKIEDLVNDMLEDDSFFIVDVQVAVAGSENIKKISVLIDADNGISIENCARLSRKLGTALEELNLIESAFHLEVSSPGLDKPLILKRQYQKNISRKLSVTKLDESIAEGKLEIVNDLGITLGMVVPDKANKKKKNVIAVEIPFAEIKKSHVIVSFK